MMTIETFWIFLGIPALAIFFTIIMVFIIKGGYIPLPTTKVRVTVVKNTTTQTRI